MRLETQQQYEREGARLFRRAARHYPEMDPVEGLIAEARLSGKIRPATLRRYRPSYLHALVLAGSLDLEADFLRLREGLERRRGRPDGDRTSSKKVSTREEAHTTFVELKRLVLAASPETDRSHSAMAAALYVLVAPRIGQRPIELLDARLEGSVLWLRNAKPKPGLPEYRPLNLRRFSATFLEALHWLIVFARAGVRKGDKTTRQERFDEWRNRIAEALARASEKVTGRRLSLYSFRHVALATWKSAGFSKADIALLAGHLSLDSASYYAPRRHGWREEVALVEVVSQTDAQPTTDRKLQQIDEAAPLSELAPQNAMDAATAPAGAATKPSEGAPTAESDEQLKWEVFPMPKAKAARTEAIDARPHFAAKADEMEEIVDRLRQRGAPLPGGTGNTGKGPPKR